MSTPHQPASKDGNVPPGCLVVIGVVAALFIGGAINNHFNPPSQCVQDARAAGASMRESARYNGDGFDIDAYVDSVCPDG